MSTIMFLIKGHKDSKLPTFGQCCQCSEQAILQHTSTEGKTTNWCRSCWNELQEDLYPTPAKCTACEEMFPKDDMTSCDNCSSLFCQECWQEEMSSWKGLDVCSVCKDMLTKDKGKDMADLPEDDWRKDR